MESAGRLLGVALIRYIRWPRRTHINRFENSSRTIALAALVAIVLIAQGCFDKPPPPPQLAEPVYPGPAEYMADGYENDPFGNASVVSYDPFFYSYYCPIPYYYYYSYYGGGGRNCIGGLCGYPVGRHPPHLPLIASAATVQVPPHDSAEVAQQMAESARSGGPAQVLNSPDSSSNDLHGAGEFGGGGFHGYGFGGGFHGSGHR